MSFDEHVTTGGGKQATLQRLLLKNRTLQGEVEREILARQRTLTSLLDVLRGLILQTERNDEEDDDHHDWASSRRYSLKRHTRKAFRDPFMLAQAEDHSERAHWESVFVVFPLLVHPQYGGPFDWTPSLDDLLLATKAALELSLFDDDDDALSESGGDDAVASDTLWNQVANTINASQEAQYLLIDRRKVSPIDCYQRYHNVLTCSKVDFTSCEDAVVLDYVKRQDDAVIRAGPHGRGGHTSWSRVAKAVVHQSGLQRSAFQCAARFQQVLNEGFVAPSSLVTSHMVAPLELRRIVEECGAFRRGEICLALNRNFVEQCESPWVPLQRLAVVGARESGAMEYEQLIDVTVGSTRTIATTTLALLAAQAIRIFCTGGRNPFPPIAVLFRMLNSFGVHAKCQQEHQGQFLCDAVSLNDVRHANSVACQQDSLLVTLEQCAEKLSCPVKDVSRRIVNAWMNKPNSHFYSIALDVFHHREFVAVVRTFILQHLLQNRVEEHRYYPTMKLNLKR